ncbi:MAG: bifunctional (p)ppGpp synthetase/guanosine-3',5'-bis(diphosphate) 3'-pyrophosphohydrolase [Thermanaerothrix sp.]|nr:bifunctional (p)ppGpp synthetase/guanosine-3',5'-bis(diphosphate) 3'-pyrophosphohydrolase [Thermanaerothrix sp.]
MKPSHQYGSSSQPMAQERGIRALMEGFIGRMPEDHRVGSVRIPLQELWSKASKYMDRQDLMKLGEALVFAANAHRDQKRHSGEPYVVHSISVAAILADMELDVDTLCAALLHDVLEDTDIGKDEMQSRFGEDVVTMVDGVTKLGKLAFKSMEDYQAENLRKMFLVMAKDIRVVLIKLADRLHNMRTLQAHRRDKQITIAKETLEIYAPLAHRLGIYNVKRELEDLCFKILEPEVYYEIRRRVRKKLPEREAIIKQALDVLQQKLKEEGIEASLSGRPKHFYSIYEKMRRKNLSLEQLYDLLALRVVVGTVAECYQVLGLVHTIWKPIPGQFDDYIANPKSNMYQSLHTTVLGPSGEPLEVQIRTWEMHWLAEYGIAAHWHYKEGKRRVDQIDQKLSWIRQVLESQQEGSPSEFLDNLKTDVLTSEVLVFTPKGDVVSLPNGSTPIDFAYAIHTEVGHKCVGAMVNGRIVPMDYKLSNGDIVRVLTSPQGKPSRDWLKIARSNRTRNKIKSYFRQQDRAEREERLERGKDLLQKELLRRAPSSSVTLDMIMPQLNQLAHDIGYSSGEDLILAVGSGNQTPSGVLSRVSLDKFEREKPEERENLQEVTIVPAQPLRKEVDAEIVVEGAEGVLVSLAQCCRPVPGDPITGSVTKSRGITVHRSDCPNVKSKDQEKLVAVYWGKPKTKYVARILAEGFDRPGLFSDVTSAISVMDGSLVGVKANVIGNAKARMILEVMVNDLEHLYRIMGKVGLVNGISGVQRG